MSKSQRKQQSQQPYERDEKARHTYNYLKKQQDHKMLRNLDKALRSKDYTRLVHSDEY